MKLILEETFDLENVIELNESTNQKTYVIKGTFSTPDKKNRNGRIYAKKLWEDTVDLYQKEISGKTSNTLMEKEHPQRNTVDPWKAVAQIRKLEMREGMVYGEAELLNIPETMVMRALIDKGVKIGVSSRGVGKLVGEIVEEFHLTTYDIVSTPSDYNANLTGFNESMLFESVDYEVDAKGKWVCTPTGCTMVAESKKEEKEKLTAMLEAKNVTCPSCKAAAVSFIVEDGDLKLKCNECDTYSAVNELEKQIIENSDGEDHEENCECPVCVKKKEVIDADHMDNGTKETNEAAEEVVDAFWAAYVELKKDSSKKAAKYLEKIANDIDDVIKQDTDLDEVAAVVEPEPKSEKSCGCKAKELTEAFEKFANKAETDAHIKEEADLKAKFDSYMNKPVTEGKDISKEVQKRLKKDGEVMLINPDEILVSFTDFDDGYFVGIDQFDNDVETETLKGYRLDESVSVTSMKKEDDIAVSAKLSNGNTVYFTDGKWVARGKELAALAKWDAESLKEATQAGDLLGELSDAMMACEKAMKRDGSSLLGKFTKESKKAFDTYEKYDEIENGKDY